ncbi:uncharacterized protein PFL1_03441 [Pseudozyma flocculosa PF-1]|uniref:Related to thioesterase n=2 Tax=Pseudozyma flocculosa TaxID=84751 RepID=A0A5C3FBB4_9BASI|nr:uncharacterized protein PFL1_03441 [Pseudozyma flocculosa PF-1]EPQ29154.1 hypothetical protein PFL1_03441 [Pseudozyma flocculosa PF-1]SPO41550.1 related to thioesterase [Pseudozyma flocculosa]
MTASDRDPRLGPWAFEMDIPTRWLDNDQYGHLNNSAYYLIADSIVNTYLITHCGIEPFQHSPPPASSGAASSSGGASSADVIGLVISSSANYYAPTSFPSNLRVKLRAVHLGRSSVRYEVGVFEQPLKSMLLSTATGSKDASLTVQRAEEVGGDKGGTKAAVVTQATHVFVDRASRRPVKAMPDQLRRGLERLVVGAPSPAAKL